MNEDEKQTAGKGDIGGHGLNDFDTVLSVDEVAHEAEKLAAEAPSRQRLSQLVGKEPLLTIEGLRAGYGKMQILHEFDLQVGVEQSLCIIGPNGAGKSTVLHSIYGFTNIMGGGIKMGGSDITRAVRLVSTDRVNWSLTVSLPVNRTYSYRYVQRLHNASTIGNPPNWSRARLTAVQSKHWPVPPYFCGA